MKAIERLYQYFDFKGIKPTRFEKDHGISNGYFGITLKRNADIGSSIVETIINNCRDLNLIWLITGNGRMLNSTDESEKKEAICQVRNCDFMNMIDIKDLRIIGMAKEIGKLESEIATLKKERLPVSYGHVAEPELRKKYTRTHK